MKTVLFLLLTVIFGCTSAAPVEYNSTIELSDYATDEVTDDDVTGAPPQCLSPELAAEITKIVNNASPFIKHQGNLPAFAATSCKQMLSLKPESKSGYYWIQGPTRAVRAFCLMDSKELFNEEGVWMKIADVNMTKPAATCPDPLEQQSVSSRELCHRSNTGCSSVVFPTHKVPYKKVCGRVIGYQYYSTDAFHPFYSQQSYTVDNSYVDGVSITQETTPRQHIWTFAAARDEVPSNSLYSCPCTNSLSHVAFTGLIPEFVGDDYFCESGTYVSATSSYYFDDPLWDGKGCGQFSSCCDGSKKPWFCKELPEPVETNIELRLCHDSYYSDEDILLETIELYVQ